MKRTFVITCAALAMSAGMTASAMAADGTSCTDFMAMDAAGQAAASASMALPSDLNPASDDSTAADAQVAAVMQACEAHPDMMVEEAMEMMDS